MTETHNPAMGGSAQGVAEQLLNRAALLPSIVVLSLARAKDNPAR